LWRDPGLVGVPGVRHGYGRNAVAACPASQTACLVIAGLSFGLWYKWWLVGGVINPAASALTVR